MTEVGKIKKYISVFQVCFRLMSNIGNREASESNIWEERNKKTVQ